MERYYISSTKHSIYERQTKKHGKVYDVSFRVVDPETRLALQKRLGGFKTKTEAHEAYAKFVVDNCEIRRNYAVKPKPTVKEYKPKSNTVGELYKVYISSLSNQIKESTLIDKQSCFNNHILPKYESVPIENLTADELHRFQDDLWAKRKPDGKFYSYKRLHGIRTHFAAFLAFCESRYNYPNNFKYVKCPKRRGKRQMQIWTREEFDKFLECVDEPKYRALFAVLFFTGKRKGEVLALSPEDVNLSKRTIRINKSLTKKTADKSYKITSTKADKNEIVIICDALYDILKEYQPSGTNFYFEGKQPGTPISENAVRHAFDSATEKAGLPRIRVHDLRHSYASMLIHLGANLLVVADLLGDTVEQVEHTYGHLYTQDKIEILKKIK